MEKVWIKNYEPGVAGEVNVKENKSIVELLEKIFSKFGPKPAISNFGKTITYSELDYYSKRFASYLQNDLKLEKGARVAIMMPNLIQYPIAAFGALRAGMIVVNVNPLYTAKELEHQLNDSGAETIVIFSGAGHTLEAILSKTPVKNVILTNIGDMLPFPKSLLLNAAVKYIKKLVKDFNLPNATMFKDALGKGNVDTYSRPQVESEDTAFLQYTGGTTGVSKGAVLTHSNICANVAQAKAWIANGLEEGKEIVITPLPLYHIFSLTANMFTLSSVGAHNIFITNPRDFKGFVKELKKWKFTVFTGVNTLFNALINTEGFSELDFSKFKLTLGGGMAVQKAVATEWKKVTGVTLIEAYGLTETSPAACMNRLDLKEYNGFIGLPISNTEVAIKDDDENTLGFDENGEICIKGPQVMAGYWNRPEETAKVMTKDGYFKTGDIGFMNKDGYCKIVDRKKDMILVSGFNVYPNEVEDAVITHEKILEVAAVGVADAKCGEVVKLFIVKKDPSLTEEEVVAHCKSVLTGYKRPKFIEFRDELPKSNVGKILRKDLRTPAPSPEASV